MHIDVYHNTRYTVHVRKICTPRAIDFLRCATVVDTDDDDDDNNNECNGDNDGSVHENGKISSKKHTFSR